MARLHVADSSVLFSATGDVPVTAGPVPTSGSGRRMMWYAGKAAFRAGYVPSSNWDAANIGNYSVAFGNNTTASGFVSTSMGFLTTASGNGSTSMGIGTIASGEYSTSMGSGTIASGHYSTSMGYTTNASGNLSTSMGQYTIASGIISTSMGFVTKASGLVSTSMGDNTTASGQASTSMGILTTASAFYSTSMGHSTTASGVGATSMGLGTIAKSINSLVIGSYNDTTNTNRLFEIGNGAANNARNNVLTVVTNGDIGIGTNTPFAYGHGGFNRILELNNSLSSAANVQSQLILSSYGSSGSLGGITWASRSLLTGDQRTGFIGNVFENANQTKLSFYTRDNGGSIAERLYLQGNGNAWLQGTLTQASDARLKTNIHQIKKPLEKLNQLHGYTYNWIDQQQDQETQIGVLAQEVQKVYPDLVKTNTNGNLSVNYMGLIPVLIEAIKDQQKIMDAQQKKIDLLISRFNILEKK